jgi:uncharacterized membrane protein
MSGTLLALATTGWGSPAGAAPLPDALALTVEPRTTSVVLGEAFDLTVTISNNGTSATDQLVVHLDITNPDQSTSVDPEDWTPTLNRTVDAIAPGRSTAIAWSLQPISPGTFAAYAVALSPGADSVTASNVLEVRVADRRSLNPGGVLPIVISVPGLVLSLLLLQRWFARRDRGRATVPPAAGGVAG